MLIGNVVDINQTVLNFVLLCMIENAMLQSGQEMLNTSIS